ncbi:hypothetical protein SAMN04244572_03209 [Azotobacter beijerinckii]|uniref:Uncharacterized protein n=1 Tax=Azotobacter beijerinckii TaxID=170623 RepID=A0A1H6XFQ7_9GAMM|nr:hypothetical protein [Azotobacter beijerinckii]SEJ23405.1 hypothetical protein SAMN04244572_03209 [Azotobacter beijerinckii]
MKSARAERSKQAAVLEYQECSACGHCHFDALRVAGRIVATGAEAQRAFNALDAGQPCPPSAPEPAKAEPATERWIPAAELPPRDALIRVEYLRGGYYISHGKFFDSVWDLIARWQPHDNSEALRKAAIPKYPPGLSTPEWLLPPADRATRPPLPNIPEPSLPPVGANFSFAF